MYGIVATQSLEIAEMTFESKVRKDIQLSFYYFISDACSVLGDFVGVVVCLD